MPNTDRRAFLQTLLGMGAAACSGWSPHAASAAADAALKRARIVIIGGGFGGSTCALYLKRLAPELQVILIEPQQRIYTCPMSNLVVAGLRDLSSLAIGYEGLRKQQIQLIHGSAESIDSEQRSVILSNKQRIHYDRLVVAPGVDFKWNSPEGYDAKAANFMPHAWKAGPQTMQLRERLHKLRNGGVVAISVPQAPFRCPPGPYERASLMACFLKRHKPRSKILILDANEKFSKQPLFEEAWQKLYPGMIERLSISADGAVRRVAAKSLTLFTELGRYSVALANVIPSQYAGAVARNNGLSDASGWCPVVPGSFASRLRPHTHLLGDACIADPMPKSASSANSQAKQCALTIVANLLEQTVPEAVLHNTCYSLIDPDYGISINAIYHAEANAITPVSGAGGTSPLAADAAFRRLEAGYTLGWYRSIVHDSFAV